MSTDAEVSAYINDAATYVDRLSEERLGYKCVFALVLMPVVDGHQRFTIVGNIHDTMLLDMLRAAVHDYDQAIASGALKATEVGPMQ
jgi:hypothetical protein